MPVMTVLVLWAPMDSWIAPSGAGSRGTPFRYQSVLSAKLKYTVWGSLSEEQII